MSDLKAAFERSERALTLRPSAGRSTGTTKVKIRDGLVCDITSGPWQLVCDMPRGSGGTATAPTPGVYGRAALGACLAITYQLWAAKLGVPIQSLEVEIQCDYDDGQLYGIEGAPRGYTEIRYIVSVESTASEDEVRRVIGAADAHSPYLDVFGRAQTVVRTVEIKGA